MDSSALGTAQLVLGKADSTTHHLRGRSTLPPGCVTAGCTTPGGSSCVIVGGSARVDPLLQGLTIQWAPPAGSPADLPLVFTYRSDCQSCLNELGYFWEAPYHRFAEPYNLSNPPSVNINTPLYIAYYAGPSPNYTSQGPNNNSLVGSTTTGWTETQPNGTAFTYDILGVLRTIRNRMGVRWTLTWDAGFDLVQHIDGPFGRRTTFAYDANSMLRRIQDPGGRITTVTVNANKDLVRIISPELCITSLVYDNAHHLTAWVNPLGDRTTFIYRSGGTVGAVQQPLGQRTSYTTLMGSPPPNAIINPRGGRTTLTNGSTGSFLTSVDPLGNQVTYKWDPYSARLSQVIDARRVRFTYAYQSFSTGVYSVSEVRKPGYTFNYTSGKWQYAFAYDSNNRVRGMVDELGNRSTLVWDANGNRIAVVDPYLRRTSFAYDSMGRLVATQNALGQRATQLYDAQGRQLADINPLGKRTTYAYDQNSQLLRVVDPLGHITTRTALPQAS